jgi:hypothetical protein
LAEIERQRIMVLLLWLLLLLIGPLLIKLCFETADSFGRLIGLGLGLVRCWRR